MRGYDDWKCTPPDEGPEIDWDPDFAEDEDLICSHCNTSIPPHPIDGCVGWSRHDGAVFEFKCNNCGSITDITVQADYYMY